MFALLEDAADRHAQPWPILSALLEARDSGLQRRALDATVRLSLAGRLIVTPHVLTTLAERADEEGSALASPAAFGEMTKILPRGREDLLHDLLAEGSTPAIRRLAARLLDLASTSPAAALVARLLGTEAANLLAPYLTYTCATHQDLLDVVPLATDSAALDSFRRAGHVCGRRLLFDIVASLGWRRVNFGLEARPMVGVSVAGAFPLLLDRAEARIFDGLSDVRRVFDRLLIVAVGGSAAAMSGASDTSDLVSRFRAYNVVHADVLGEILDVAPLTRARLNTVLDRMRRLVADFNALFGGSTDRAVRDETAALVRVHANLAERIGRTLALASGDPLPMDVCRLVQPFEDPTGPSDIRTLHGLKRYLHQRGLKLAFGLIGTGPRTTRTVDLAVAMPGRGVEVGRHIEFVDLEGESQSGPAPSIPYQVRLVVEAFAVQLLHGVHIQPSVRVFCYGNEVHYFARYRNHPAFIRIDYSPPLRGGMIDLQYAGVSINELSVHPCPSLDAIRLFFERLDFIVSVDSTRIQARYDKERAFTIDALHQRAAMLFHLVPYLMDVDWAIGSLQVNEEARRMVAEAWAGCFERWGVLPMEQMLTKDRAGIVQAIEAAPEGPREIRWNGRAPYRDRFSVEPPSGLVASLGERLGALGIELTAPVTGADLAGQVPFDARVLGPLRAALARGEIHETPAGLARRPNRVFERIHEVDRLAAILESDPDLVARSAHLAHVVPLLERHVGFKTTGTINGYDVQQARVRLGADDLTMYVLRDATGMPRMACAALDGCLWRRRSHADAPWEDNARYDIELVLDRLRRSNILGSTPDRSGVDPVTTAEHVRRLFRVPRSVARGRPLATEQVVSGVSASPGRAAGLARLGASGRRREDLDGAILLAARLGPNDAPCLFQAAGVVATGGGVLSHLGLLAVESGKPALIIDGTWTRLPKGDDALAFTTLEYEERESERYGYRLTERHHLRDVEGRILDGDLVVLDADQGTLTVLGHDAVALALHESLREHAAATRCLAQATDLDAVLLARGHHLRARHQLEKSIRRVSVPGLARYAVEELLGQLAGSETASTVHDGVALLRLLAENRDGGDAARMAIQQTTGRLASRIREAREQAVSLVPSCTTCHDVLALRLKVVRLQDTLMRVTAALDSGGLDAGVVGTGDGHDVDDMARARLCDLRDQLAGSLASGAGSGGWRPRLAQLRRLGAVVGLNHQQTRLLAPERADDRSALGSRLIVTAGDGGLELERVAGAKAANLAEIARILGEGVVPDWFAVTVSAFQAATGPSGRQTIDAILRDSGIGADGQAAAIRAFWTRVEMPADLVSDIVQAYRALGPDCHVAVRSSALDEDTEQATRAGQFETFLFVRGEQAVVEHVKLVWSGLWAERAIAGRAAERTSVNRVSGLDWPRCGVVVQRMVPSRVSGVLQTINAADARPREMVINVVLGLGEGIVSGVVSADHIVVVKTESPDGMFRFRYMVADKRERVIFDARCGHGTVRVGTLAHQRLRPALEYPELLALVGMATRLERAYGHPLDIEFGFEDAHLRVLQVRPMPASLAVWTETIERFPLAGGARHLEVLP
ncbi:MAG: PEP-utilizing enzyme [Acidobacteria bacterium]|nr:PEP-utilizing enzyme [Acidobacteriota bacterium]